MTEKRERNRLSGNYIIKREMRWWDLAEYGWDLSDCAWNLADCEWDLAEFGWDLAECGWDLADCGWDLAECKWYLAEWGWDLAELLERLTANAEDSTVLGSISASSDTVESEVGQLMKQCWIQYIEEKNSPFIKCINKKKDLREKTVYAILENEKGKMFFWGKRVGGCVHD